MTAIKSRILQIWDTAPPGIRICCIKFAQRVVLVQTAAPDGDNRVCAYPNILLQLFFADIILTAQRLTRHVTSYGSSESYIDTPSEA
jgi:hypothetical protein